MDILSQLSSQVGDRTEESNRQVVARCMHDPTLLDQIVAGLQVPGNDAALTGDCAEVLTHVAGEHPEWVAPHASALIPLLSHRKTRVRWEAMHALALVADRVPGVMAGLLPRLAEIIAEDRSVIVRDYAVDAVGRYAQSSAEAARAAYPILITALTAWEGKQAAHALDGLVHVAAQAPELRDEIYALGVRYHDHGRSVVRRAARRLLKRL